MNRFDKYGFSVEEIEKMLDMPTLINIKDSKDIKAAGLENQSIVNYYPRIDVSKNFNRLAEKIGGEFVEKESFFDYVLKGIGLK